MSKDLIEDPGPILDPGKGGKPLVGVPDVFHKIESLKDVTDDALAEKLNGQEVEGFEILLPAIAGGDSFVFLKIEDAIPEDFEDLLLPAVQAADKMPFLTIKWDYSDPELDQIGQPVITDSFDLG